ncbi:MAG TPA: protein kinase [Burkholderiaceae bacterium]|nr:protein kinase [Burkholderiaceae bacterium]
MATTPPEILIVDDDRPLVGRARQYLEDAGFKVRVAEDGLQGLAAVMMRAPDVVMTGMTMKKMDGIGLMQSLRANDRTRTLPIVVLAPEHDNAELQRAQAAGADAVLLKPVPRELLLSAVSDALKTKPLRNQTTMAGLRFTQGASLPVATSAPKLEQHTLPANFAQFLESSPQTLIGESILDPDEDLIASQMISKRTTTGTVLFSDIRNFTSISEQLRSEQVVEMLNAYFARACEPIQRQHGWVVKFLGDGLVALFESPEGQLQDHAERAIKAGLLMVLAAMRFRSWIRERHPNLDLPEFAIGVGVHTGEITVCKMGGSETVETTIIGDTVNIAARLEEKTKEVGWSLVSSEAAFESAGARVLRGQHSALTVKGRNAPVEITEITGLAPKANANEQERKFYEAVAQAVALNSKSLQQRIAEKAAAAAAGVDPLAIDPTSIKVPGYRVMRKLGEGGMSLVYLAGNDKRGGDAVLKMLRMAPETEGEILQRFIQEYRLISQIDHPNVAKIYEQGFTQTHAYIAMEYFPGGDLRALSKAGLKPDVAQAVLIQIAGALAAIHARGIVHRDMKPDNVMLRDDGSLGLADFGIAKHIDNKTLTRHGEVFGTPYYLSPEQALGGAVDQRSDIYSLGVMLFEMLTGRKPYYADNAQALLYQHVHAPVPTLPQEHTRFQPLLNRMMAKKPAERYQRADDIIESVIRL